MISKLTLFSLCMHIISGITVNNLQVHIIPHKNNLPESNAMMNKV